MHCLPRGEVHSLAAVAATADSLAGGMLGSSRDRLSLETLHSTPKQSVYLLAHVPKAI